MIRIVSLVCSMASVCVASSVIAAAPSVATVESPSLLSARVVAPSWLSGVYGHSVVSVPALATKHVTVARPGHVAVERLNVGSIPSVSVVNEPTTIVTPGKPIRGHSYTSEVRHDKRVAAPVFATYSAPIQHEVEAPQVVEAIPSVGRLSSEYVVASGSPSRIVSAPQVFATGPAALVAAPASVKGYTLETGRTDLINEVRLRAASIPATIYQDSIVESVPAVAPVYSSVISQPLVANTLSAPLLTKTLLWKK